MLYKVFNRTNGTITLSKVPRWEAEAEVKWLARCGIRATVEPYRESFNDRVRRWIAR